MKKPTKLQIKNFVHRHKTELIVGTVVFTTTSLVKFKSKKIAAMLAPSPEEMAFLDALNEFIKNYADTYGDF